MGDISTWNVVDESNTSAPPDGWPEGMATNAVNNCARAMMGAVRRWYDNVQWELAYLGESLADMMPLSGGTFTGPITAPSIHSNSTLSASTDIAASGTITGNLLQSNGNIAAAGDISCNDLTATGVITGALLQSTGAVTGTFVQSSGALAVGTNFDVVGNGSIHGTLGVEGDIVTNSSLTVAGNISSGDINAVGVVSTPYLRSNTAHLAGTLLTWGGTHHLNFRWNGASLLYRIDEVTEGPVVTAEDTLIEEAIATTSMIEELRGALNRAEARLTALERRPELEPA